MPMHGAACNPTRWHKRQFPVPTHTSAPVPHAPARFAVATALHDIAEAARGCKQPQAFGHMHRRRFPHMCWACATFRRATHGPEKKGDVCLVHAASKRASAWGIGAEVCMRTRHRRPSVHAHGALAPNCACACGTSAQVCMCSGHCLNP